MNKIQNEGAVDRVVRVIFGIALFLLPLGLTGVSKIIVFIIATILVITGITGFCAIYKIFSINTLKK
jgi:hypothetical protein